jgi:hypothetical protein
MSEGIFTYDSWETSLDYLYRMEQLPRKETWVHHPGDIRVGGWTAEYDYSKWPETEGSSDRLCALPPEPMSIMDLIFTK